MWLKTIAALMPCIRAICLLNERLNELEKLICSWPIWPSEISVDTILLLYGLYLAFNSDHKIR